MERNGLDWLTQQLRAAPSPAVAALPDSDLKHLGDAVRHARQRQTEQLQAASDKALEHIPRLLRGTVKKIVN